MKVVYQRILKSHEITLGNEIPPPMLVPRLLLLLLLLLELLELIFVLDVVLVVVVVVTGVTEPATAVLLAV